MPKMRQKKFTFSKHFAESYDKNIVPTKYLTWKDAFVAQLLKQGYLVKDVKETETITISCYAARANVTLKEREKIQKNITNTKLISKPYQTI